MMAARSGNTNYGVILPSPLHTHWDDSPSLCHWSHHKLQFANTATYKAFQNTDCCDVTDKGPPSPPFASLKMLSQGVITSRVLSFVNCILSQYYHHSLQLQILKMSKILHLPL